MQDQIKAIRNHDKDNVATLFGVVTAGSVVNVMEKAGDSFEVKVLQDIPYGHKIALSKIAPGDEVTKYGEEIGIATQPISIGEHVHIQNIDSIRGRGDWDQKGASK